MINPAINGPNMLPIGVCEPSTENLIELPPEGAKNVMDILDAEPNPTECMVLPFF